MTAQQVRLEFAPPPVPGMLRAFALAIAAHAVLLAILALGVQWKRDPTPVTVEAELWSTLPVQAAPMAPEPPPPEPVQPPPVVTPPPIPVPAGPDPNIVLAREKAKQQKAKELERERMELEVRQREAAKAQKLKAENDARDKKQAQEQQKTQSAKSDADAKKIAELRKQQIERMNRMAAQASGSGDATSQGTAKQSSGPSASYTARINARVRPNITHTEPIVGNPMADVEVRMAPDGTIIGRKLVKSSGVSSWDEAVLRAIDKTEVLPRNEEGIAYPSLVIGFSPRGAN